MGKPRLLICPVCGKERMVTGGRKESDGRCRTCFQLKEHNPHWKGGRVKDGGGYVLLRMEKDDAFNEMASRHGYVLEHRIVMARHLGRLLLKQEKVHHVNGIRDDNRIENLELLSQADHLLYKQMCSGCPLRKEVRNLKIELAKLQGKLTW